MTFDLRCLTARRRRTGPGIRARLRLPLVALLLVAQVQTAAAAIVNDAVALAHYGGATVTSAKVSASVPVSPLEAVLEVTKVPDPLTFSAEGQVIDYTLTITNGGTSTLMSVAVFDPSAAAVICPDGNPIATLAPGQSEVCSATSAITAADMAAGSHVNTVSATALTSAGDAIGPVTAQATVTRDVSGTTGMVSGTVFLDGNSDGVLSAGDTIQPGMNVQLLLNGIVVATTTTASDGSYSFANVPTGSGYSVVAIDPGTGAAVSGEGRFDVAAGANVTDVNLPIDPSGVVYDAATRLPVAGARVTLTTAAGIPLPDACLASPAQQNQVTTADGAYRFDVMAGADPACPAAETEYRIEVLPPAGYAVAPSTAIPPQVGALDATSCPVDAIPGGSCQVQSQPVAPSGPQSTVYFLAFLLALGDPHVVHNHIPLDAAASQTIVLSKSADRRLAHRGDEIAYTIFARNDGPAIAPVTIVDDMPGGFRLVEGSARLDGATVTPVVSGQQLTFAGIALPANGSVTITMRLMVLTSVTPGRYVNTASIFGPDATTLAPPAKTTVEIVGEPIFDCADVIGKVFDDLNRNGYAEDGEPGLAGIRLATVKGVLITTDKAGRFHVACADIPQSGTGANFILKLDTRTLPTGYRVTTENPRVVRLTPGKTVKMNFGAAIGRVVKLDLNAAAFADGSSELVSEFIDQIGSLVAVLRGEPSVLQIVYHGPAGEVAIAKRRLAAVVALVRKRWVAISGPYHLEIDTEIELGN